MRVPDGGGSSQRDDHLCVPLTPESALALDRDALKSKLLAFNSTVRYHQKDAPLRQKKKHQKRQKERMLVQKHRKEGKTG